MSIDSSMQSAYDIEDMQKAIHEIDVIMQGWTFDAERARQKIVEINDSHPENVTVHNLLFSPGQFSTSIAHANDEQLKNDLLWKRYYLNAKCAGKAVDEMRKDIWGK